MSRVLYDRTWSLLPQEDKLPIEVAQEIFKEIRNEHPEFNADGIYVDFILKTFKSGDSILSIQFIDRRIKEPNALHVLMELVFWVALATLIAWVITS